jgi:hypothetical protein
VLHGLLNVTLAALELVSQDFRNFLQDGSRGGENNLFFARKL